MYGNVEYAYDTNGNMTEVQLDGQVMFLYHYNAENRLVKVEDGNNNTIAGYYYDPFGRRLWKDVGGTLTYFFYSDGGLIAEYDASGTEIRSYGYRPDSTWTTDPLWVKQNGEYYFYQNDHLGTPQKLVKMSGAIVWSAAYIVFGKVNVEIETVTNNLRFPGQYYDEETELHYNGHRYYDPKSGRYLRMDPIGVFKETINLYGYGLNNPINFFDYSGLYLERLLDNYFRSPVDNLYWKMKRRFPPGTQPGSSLDPKTVTPSHPIMPVKALGIAIPNGCGPENPKIFGIRIINLAVPEYSGFSRYFIPGAHFTPACDAHDICYATCGADKHQCDTNFYWDLISICKDFTDRVYGKGGGSSWAWPNSFWRTGEDLYCFSLAAMYYNAVSSKIGDSAFNGAQRDCCHAVTK